MSSPREFVALDLEVGEDVGDLSRYLHQQRLPHRVFEKQGRQLLVVYDPEHREIVVDCYQRIVNGTLVLQKTVLENRHASLGSRAVSSLLRMPATAVLLMISVIGAALVQWDTQAVILRWLTFTDIELFNNWIKVESVAETYQSPEYWRLLTPIFLHFGLMHIVFNALWLWELGRRIETHGGTLELLAVVALTGGAGNIFQYLSHPDALFGGMSGVIYGLLGYAWAWNKVSTVSKIVIPPGVLGFMMVWLLICLSGFVEAAGFGAIANAAHVTGLVTGVLMGGASGILRRG